MQTNELELIARSVAKDADAYGQLIDRYKDAIYRHCFVIVSDGDVAEDIAQEAFIAAYYKLHTFDTNRKFSTWLFKIATNHALSHLRKNRRLRGLDDEEQERLVSPHRSPHESAESDEIHRAIRRLEPRYRMIIHLHFFEGMEYDEIAQLMGRPVGSIKGWMYRAKRELRKELE